MVSATKRLYKRATKWNCWVYLRSGKQILSLILHHFFKSEAGENRWKDLHNRCIEHNIRVISKAYTRIRTQRMAEHLDLSLEETERHLSEMVVKGAVWARIGEFNLP